MPSEPGHHRLRRAKSAPSVKRRRPVAQVPAPLNSEVARHHATTAASLAMAQASERMAHASPQMAARPSNEEPRSIPSARALHRRPSISSLVGERSSNGYSRNSGSDNLTSVHLVKDKSSLADMSSVREFQGFAFDEELSAPSSYRRLRKSRSMFNTRSMRSLRNAALPSSEEAESPSWRNSVECTTEPHRSLRHSLSFFNGASQSLRKMKSHGSISTRRQRLSRYENEPPVPPIPAIEERPARRQLRTTVRTLRELSPDDEISPASSGGRVHSKARSFSISIKKRLKRVFGIPSYAESQSSEDTSLDSSPHAGVGNLLFDSPTTITDGTAHPSLHPTASSESIATSASRVTSWTNSTAGNTVRTRQTIDRHSLSTIEEGYDFANQQPPDFPEMYDGSDTVRARRGKAIDSQRVYSALMRHIGETAAKDGERVVSSGTIKGSPVVMERSPSIRVQREYGSIRKIPSDLSMKTARTSFLIEPRPHSSQSPLSLRSQSLMTDRTLTPLGTKQAHRLSSGLSPKATPRESKSLFFPSAGSPKSKTPSPYRAAMNSIREIDSPERYTPSIIITGTDKYKLEPTSPSIYSRTPSGNAASREDLGYEPEEYVEPGMATIYDVQVPYKSPKKDKSQATETGPRNSAEWKHWVNCQADFGNFNMSNPESQREHHREGPECDGEPMRPGPIGNSISSHADSIRDGSLSRLRQIYTSQVSQTPDTEIRAQGQNNFSRPLSRQSIGSLRGLARQSSFNGKRQYLYQGTDLARSDIYQADPFDESPEEPVSPSRRQAIRAAREARLSRVSRAHTRRNTLGQFDYQQDAKALQFRQVPSLNKRNKENEISPSIKEKFKTTGISGIKDLHNDNPMVEKFLHERRSRQNSLTSEGISPAFI